MNRVISTDDAFIPASAGEPGLVSHVSSLGPRVDGDPFWRQAGGRVFPHHVRHRSAHPRL